MSINYPTPSDDILALHASLKGADRNKISDTLNPLGWEEIEVQSSFIYISPDKKWAIKYECVPVKTYHAFAKILLNHREAIADKTSMLPRVFGFEYGEENASYGVGGAIVLMETLESAPEFEVMEFEMPVKAMLKAAVELIRENHSGPMEDFSSKLAEICQDDAELMATALVVGQASLVSGAEVHISEGDIMQRGDDYVIVDVMSHHPYLGALVDESDADLNL